MSIIRGNKCPICGNELRYNYWSDDCYGVVESYEDCTNCNYSKGFAYGDYSLVFANKEFYYSYRENNTKYFKNIKKCLFMARRNYKKFGRKKYIKKYYKNLDN